MLLGHRDFSLERRFYLAEYRPRSDRPLTRGVAQVVRMFVFPAAVALGYRMT